MSSRVLSAYFDDFRKGKKQREELRWFLEEAIRKEPMRRGHFMGWLDQAQYEHPIPVTEFLLLRKEIEATLDNDDQTRIAHPVEPIITSPDADTLVAGDDEATVIAPNIHAHSDDATEVSSGSQPSDMARLHEVPTLIGAPPVDTEADKQEAGEQDATMVTTSEVARAMTMPSATPSGAEAQAAPRQAPPAAAAATNTRTTTKPARALSSPSWLWLVLGLLVVAGLLGYWATRPVITVIEADNSATELSVAEPVVIPEPAVIPAPVTIPVENQVANPAVLPAVLPADEAPDQTPPEATITPSTPSSTTPANLTLAQALAELKQRADGQQLLPLDSPDSAQAMLRYLETQQADQQTITEARVYLKDAYLDASKKAQGQGDWDKSQLLLDAAFEVLSPTVQ